MTDRLVTSTPPGEQVTLADVEALCAALRAEGATDGMPVWAHADRRTRCWQLYAYLRHEDLAPGWDARPGEGTHHMVRDPGGALGWAWQPDTAARGWQPEHRD